MKKLYSKLGKYLSIICAILLSLFYLYIATKIQPSGISKGFPIDFFTNLKTLFFNKTPLIIVVSFYFLGLVLENIYKLIKKYITNKLFLILSMTLLTILVILTFLVGLRYLFKVLNACPAGQERYYYLDGSGQSYCGPSVESVLYFMDHPKKIESLEECYNIKPSNSPIGSPEVHSNMPGQEDVASQFNPATQDIDKCIYRYVDQNEHITDKEICDKIQSSYYKYLCRQRIVWHLGNPDLCTLEFLKDQGNVDGCLNVLAYRLKDTSLCAKSSNPSYCISGISK